MTRRALSAALWFVAIWFGYELLWSVADVPRLVGPVLAATITTLLAVDPTKRLWSSRPPRHEMVSRLPAAGRPVV